MCINGTCQPHSVLGYDCDSKAKCHGHGVSHRVEKVMVWLVDGRGGKKEAEMKEGRTEAAELGEMQVLGGCDGFCRRMMSDACSVSQRDRKSVV